MRRKCRTVAHCQATPHLDTKPFVFPGAKPEIRVRSRAQLARAIDRSEALKAFAKYAYGAPGIPGRSSLMHDEVDLYDRVTASQGKSAAELVVAEHLAYLTSH